MRFFAAAPLAVLSLSVSLLAATTTTPLPTEPLVLTTQTEPSEKVEVPSVIRGQLVRIPVQEGQPIKKGDEIALLDDQIQKHTTALAALDAESTVEVRYNEVQVAYARNELERFRQIASSASSPAELKQKELALKQAELSLEKIKENAAKHKIEFAREQATLDRMTIRSPLDGVVLRINKHVGELVDTDRTDKPLAIIVQTQKLYARFYAPRQLFGQVKAGQEIQLNIQTQPAAQQRVAKIIAVDPVLDAASGLFQVKIEIDNATQTIPAGTTIEWRWGNK